MTQIRDIRPDLKIRITILGERREKARMRYEEELAAIDREEETLRTLLTAEDELFSTSGKLPMAVTITAGASDFENDILNILSDGKSKDHGLIKDTLLVNGYEDDARFGRSLHGTLLSMSHRDLVKSAGTGIWRISERVLEEIEAARR